MQVTTQFFVKLFFFYKQVLDFHRPFKIYAIHLGVKITLTSTTSVWFGREAWEKESGTFLKPELCVVCEIILEPTLNLSKVDFDVAFKSFWIRP